MPALQRDWDVTEAEEQVEPLGRRGRRKSVDVSHCLGWAIVVQQKTRVVAHRACAPPALRDGLMDLANACLHILQGRD